MIKTFFLIVKNANVKNANLNTAVSYIRLILLLERFTELGNLQVRLTLTFIYGTAPNGCPTYRPSYLVGPTRAQDFNPQPKLVRIGLVIKQSIIPLEKDKEN